MRTILAHTSALPSHKPEGLQHSRDAINSNSYEDGLWNGSKRYVH